MAEKAAFFDCLDDHQTGFFCAHEYDENIENQLMDVLNPTQMKLYYQYEKSKTTHGDGIISQANEEISVADYNFENQLLDKFKREKNFVWLDIWGKSQMDSEMDNFDNWRENAMEDYFLSNLSGRERGKFVTLISDVKENDFIKTRNTTNQSIYSQWKNKKISQTPPFISDLNLAANKQNIFLKLVAQKDFEALDSCMESYPAFAEMYGWWKAAVNNNTVLSPSRRSTAIGSTAPVGNLTIQQKSEDVSTDKILLEQSPTRKNNIPQTDLYSDRFTRDLFARSKEVEPPQEEKKRNTNMIAKSTAYYNQEVKWTEQLKRLASKVTSALKNDTNILLLGETQSGKTTMINSMANYFKYDSFKAASEDKLVTLVPTRFQLFDYESPKIFSFTYKNGDIEQTIRVMDTPGLGDSKGMDYDKKSSESILNAIDEFDELHAICILMKPNESTMAPGFRYCIQQLLSQLHVSAVQNIFFCFTFSNTTNYRPGQTVPTLVAVFKKMGLEGELSQLEKSRVFCFDNEAIKFLMAKEKGFAFKQGEDKRLAESYSKSSFELFRMLLETTCREPHNPKATVHLNGTRKLLNRLVKPLVEITKNQLLNQMLNREQIRQIEENRPDLMKKLKIRKVEQKLVTMETPRMVCTSLKCLGQNTVCHDRCIQKEESDLVPNPLLENCLKIKNGVCKECGCSWKEHKHLSYEIEQELIEYEDPYIRSQLASNMLRKKYLETKALEVKKQFEKVQFFVNTFCVFSLFLSRNSITQYSDVFMLYINQAIAEEKRKHEYLSTAPAQQDPLLDALKVLKTEYQNRLEKMNQVKELSVDEINFLIKDMLKVGGCETLVEQILTFKAEMKKQVKEEEIEVSYSKGFLGGEIYL